MTTVHVSIGNTDGRLSHQRWAEFYAAVDELLTDNGLIYGAWHSLPATPYVNACWAVELEDELLPAIRGLLARLAARFNQDTIAWLAGETEFIRGD